MASPRLCALLALAIVPAIGSAQDGRTGASSPVTLLNVSYDPTRELYDEVNAAFRKHVVPADFSFVKAGDFKKAGVLQTK